MVLCWFVGLLVCLCRYKYGYGINFVLIVHGMRTEVVCVVRVEEWRWVEIRGGDERWEAEGGKGT